MWDLVEEHYREASFLFRQWQSIVEHSEADLPTLCDRYESRLIGNIDGLLVAGAEAEAALLLPGLSGSDPDDAAASALVLLEARRPETVQPVIEAYGSADHVTRQRIGDALAVALPAGYRQALAALGSSSDEELAADVMRVNERLSGPRIDHEGASAPARLCPELFAGVLVQARRFPDSLDTSVVLEGLEHETSLVRDAALLTLFCRQHPALGARIDEQLERSEGTSAAALLLLAMRASEREERLVSALDLAPEAASVALGLAGYPWMALPLIERLDHESDGPLFACALTQFTAAPVEALRADPGARHEVSEPSSDDLSAETLVARATPMPERLDRTIATSWWETHKSGFEETCRHLAGQPLNRAVALSYLATGPMRCRHGVARELSWGHGSEASIQTRAFGRDQRTALEALGA